MTSLSTPYALRKAFSGFVWEGCGIDLDHHQLQAAGSILESVYRGLGSSFVLGDLPGSDLEELHTQLLCYLLRLRNDHPGLMLSIHPDPCRQVQAMDRLVERLWGNVFTRGRWCRQGDDFAFGSCRVRFRHAGDGLLPEIEPASLVIVSRAEEIDLRTYDSQFSCLPSSLAETCVYTGTEGYEGSLLERELARSRLETQAGSSRRIPPLQGEERLPSLPRSQSGTG